MSKKTAKHFVLAFSVVAITALFGISCSEDAKEVAPVPDNTSETVPETVPDDLTQEEEAVINEELETQAASEIMEDNAEAKLQELEKEILEDL